MTLRHFIRHTLKGAAGIEAVALGYPSALAKLS